MRRFLWISLALAAACGCVTSAVVEDGEPAEDEAGVYWQSEALPPADPIDAAIRLAMGTVSGKSGKTKTWELGPDVASGDKLPAETARRVRIESIEGDDDVRPLDEAELPGSVTRARLEGMKEYPGIREFIDRAEAAPELPYGGYRFHVGDVLDIVVSGDAELSGRATVRQDGRMALPGVLVLLDAAGRTIEELTADVQTTLYGSYLKKLPKVSVDIIEGPGFAVTGVIGEGKFVRVALGGATRTLKEVLLALVGEMGDTSAYRLDRVVVFEGARSRTVDARGVMSAGGRGEYLRPGAVIIIPEAGSVSYGMETAERSCSTKGRE